MYPTYYLIKGDKISCMRCGLKFILDYTPERCCINEADSARNLCGCQGTPEPLFCDNCWKEIELQSKLNNLI